MNAKEAHKRAVETNERQNEERRRKAQAATQAAYESIVSRLQRVVADQVDRGCFLAGIEISHNCDCLSAMPIVVEHFRKLGYKATWEVREYPTGYIDREKVIYAEVTWMDL